MAVATAARANHFLNLPVTVITDKNSLPEKSTYTFDRTIIVEPETDNTKNKMAWLNKGRYQAYKFSPYDETILLDTDYMINSDKLLSVFNFYNGFCLHNNAAYLMHPNLPDEYLSSKSFKTLWATVMFFNKSSRSKQVFDCMEMVQKNNIHYENVHGFLGKMYRNDYALTLALRIVNGHTNDATNFIPWDLLHVGNQTQVFRATTDQFNTEYVVSAEKTVGAKSKTNFITIKELDFHCMNKSHFLGLI